MSAIFSAAPAGGPPARQSPATTPPVSWDRPTLEEWQSWPTGGKSHTKPSVKPPPSEAPYQCHEDYQTGRWPPPTGPPGKAPSPPVALVPPEPATQQAARPIAGQPAASGAQASDEPKELAEPEAPAQEPEEAAPGISEEEACELKLHAQLDQYATEAIEQARRAREAASAAETIRAAAAASWRSTPRTGLASWDMANQSRRRLELGQDYTIEDTVRAGVHAEQRYTLGIRQLPHCPPRTRAHRPASGRADHSGDVA